VFLCFLMLIGTMGIFFVTTLCGGASELFEPYYMFRHIDGRVVITTQNGAVLSEEQVKSLAEEYGATSYLRFDNLLDSYQTSLHIPCGDSYEDHKYVTVDYTYGESFGENIVGRYPEANNEVFLYLPISYRPAVGADELLVEEVRMGRMNLKLTGVKYYYDNNLTAKCLFTDEGFRTATAIHYLMNFSNLNLTASVTNVQSGWTDQIYLQFFTPSFDMEADKIYVDTDLLPKYSDSFKDEFDLTVNFRATYYKYNHFYDDGSRTITFERVFDENDLTFERPEINNYDIYEYDPPVFIISDELLCRIAEEVLDDSYKQASLFFANDKEAHRAAEALQQAGYIAVPSDTTYTPDAATTIISVLTCLMLAFVWIIAVIFLAFFINLCSSRTLSAFKGDMAIMRSMGIQVKVIRIGMYVRMLLSLIPAFVLVVLTAFLVFTSPKFNEYFVYLYAWQYALIFLGMIALTVRITYKQIRKLFGESVKKSLKGGAAE